MLSAARNFGNDVDVIRRKEMRMYYRFLQTINWKTAVITLLSVLITVICYVLNITMNMRTDLIGIAVVFPIVFAINSAFKRREEALKSLAIMKGNAFAVRLAFGHWVKVPATNDKLIERIDYLLRKLFTIMQAYLVRPPNADGNLQADIIGLFVLLSLTVEEMRTHGVAPPEISRVNEYLRVMCVQYQEMNNIRNYRTPVALRAYTKFFLALFPLLFGPTFSYIAHDSGTLVHGIILAVVYSVVLTGLDNIQEMMENPYDGIGADDIRFESPDNFTFLAASMKMPAAISEDDFSDKPSARNADRISYQSDSFNVDQSREYKMKDSLVENMV